MSPLDLDHGFFDLVLALEKVNHGSSWLRGSLRNELRCFVHGVEYVVNVVARVEKRTGEGYGLFEVTA